MSPLSRGETGSLLTEETEECLRKSSKPPSYQKLQRRYDALQLLRSSDNVNHAPHAMETLSPGWQFLFPRNQLALK